MRRVLAASLSVGFLLMVPGLAIAKAPGPQHVRQYKSLYRKARHDFGKAVGCNLEGQKGSCHRKVSDAELVKSIEVLQRFYVKPAPAPVAPSQPSYTAPANQGTTYSAPLSTTTYSSVGGYANVPGVPSSFASCVAMRESTNGAGSSNLYGIQGPGGQGSIGEQKAAFSQMYAARGTKPWSPYDGCH